MKAILSASGFLFAVSLLEACGTGSAAPAPPPPPGVAVVEVVKQDVPIRSEWITTLDGYVNAQIQPQVSGYLIKQNYEEGTYVNKGDVLFEIDPRTFQAQLDQARAQLAQAEAQLGRANNDVERDRPLAEARAIARSQLDNDVQARAAAAGAVDSARAAIRTAQLNLEFTKVRSLTDGVAGIARGQIGDLVGPTTLLTTVSKLDPIKAYVSISETEYLEFVGGLAPGDEPRAPFPAGDTLELMLAGDIQYSRPGKFVFADRQVDPATGTIRVAAAFPNPGNVLRPGQFGRVRATVSVRKDALVVPQRAVTELQGSFTVAVVDKDNKVSIKKVIVGPRVGSVWVVEHGLEPGEKVVAEGTQKVREGTTVNPMPYQASASKG
jgi:RND family efflux transporter MFP subunit